MDDMATNTLEQESVSVSAAHRVCDMDVAEPYYDLVHWLRSVGNMAGLKSKTIGVTACARGAGTSTVASNLALAAAQISEQPVLLLDLTDTRSAIPTRFTASDDLRLRGALGDVLRPGECVKTSPIANLSRLAASQLSDFPALSVDCGRVGDLLRAMEPYFDFIVIDLPIVESSLCFLAAESLSGVLLVMEAEHIDVERAARVRQRLIDARANVVGMILNELG
jgi:Mrp family chromosome partitioning ATPase